MKIRPFPVLAGLLLVAVALLAVREVRWRIDYPEAGPPIPSPDGAVVAEMRALPADLRLGAGVFLRRRWDLLRSVRPRLVVVGDCSELTARWFGQRRLVVQCVLRAGEPALLQEVVDDVKIELVVDRHFG